MSPDAPDYSCPPITPAVRFCPAHAIIQTPQTPAYVSAPLALHAAPSGPSIFHKHGSCIPIALLQSDGQHLHSAFGTRLDNDSIRQTPARRSPPIQVLPCSSDKEHGINSFCPLSLNKMPPLHGFAPLTLEPEDYVRPSVVIRGCVSVCCQRWELRAHSVLHFCHNIRGGYFLVA